MVNKKQKPQKPPLSPARIVGESIAGAIGAIIGVVPLLALVRNKDSEWGFGYILMLFWTFPLGGLITAVGVYLAGSAGNQTGSFWAALAGAALGVAAVFAITVGAVAGDCSIVGGALFAIALASPVLGATIGFNLTRKYKYPPHGAKKPPLSKDGKPPLDVAIIVIQVLAGTAAAFIPRGLAHFSSSVAEFISMFADSHPFFMMVPLLYFLFLPLVLSAILVYIVGRIGNQTGSFGTTFAGSILAMLIGVPIGFISRHLGSLVLLARPFVVSLGATIRFNLTRKYKSPPT